MNGQLMDMWGRWLANALHGQNQMDLVSSWWLRNMEGMTPFGKSYGMLWSLPSAGQANRFNFDGFQQVWESLFKFQQLYMQWMQMVPQGKYDELFNRAEELEATVREQARTIDRLRNFLRDAGGENNVVVAQLQELIGQQSQQFKQMTQNVSDYIKSSTQKVSKKK